MRYLLKLSSSANSDLNFWVSKQSKNTVLGVQRTRYKPLPGRLWVQNSILRQDVVIRSVPL